MLHATEVCEVARQPRRLAAVLAADVVGYSRLMGRDEAGTLARLKEHRSQRLEPILARNGGRLVKLTGDGALIEFNSAVDGLTAAVEFQQAVEETNALLSEAQRIVFRIGLHLGDMIVDGDDLYGDGVNVAARLEAEAPPSGIVVSGAFRDAVSGKLDAVGFVDLGALALKNIDRPVRAYRVVRGNADEDGGPSPTTDSLRVPPPLPDRPSIAVLPFQNITGDSTQAYFADGIVEDIITALSHFRGFFVISRNSSFTYKGKATDVRQVGRELGVRYVVEGSCRESGNMVRVTTQLIDCATGTSIWAETFDRKLGEAFTVQEEITRAIVSRIAPTIEASTLARVRHTAPGNLNAYDLALRAWAENEAAFWHSDPKKLRDKALQTAEQALKLDPDCVRAWVVIALVHWEYCAFAGNDTESHRRLGLEALQRAISLDRFEHRAYMIRGGFELEVGHFDEALADYELACKLNPSDALALTVFAWGQVFAGEGHSAKARVFEAMRLSPRDPQLGLMTSVLALAHFQTGEYAEGLRWADESKREKPDSRITIATAARLYVGIGDLPRAREEAERIRTPGFERYVESGASRFRYEKDRERDVGFMRVALGLEAALPPLQRP